MELSSMMDKSPEVRKRKCSSCGTDFSSPQIDISIPGLNKIFDKSYQKVPKIIWLIVMIICAAACAFLTFYQLRLYFSWPISSKTTIERKDKVQFPSLSICVVVEEGEGNIYRQILYKDIKDQCQENHLPDCETNIKSLNLQELNVSLEEIWDACGIDKLGVTIETVDQNIPDTDIVRTRSHTALGSCETIRQISVMNYFSTRTRMEVKIDSTEARMIIFIPHGESEFTDYEFFNHEMEFIPIDAQYHVKISEEEFNLLNSTERPCYHYYAERERLQQHALEQFSKKGACRLPFLPDNFPECQTYNDVDRSLNIMYVETTALWSDRYWSGRRACRYKSYGMSVDYSRKVSRKDIGELVIKFADNTVMIIEEFYSYSFAALVSDLFAYWGFFLCLSALVFVEIFEFVFRKLYTLCKIIFSKDN